MTAMAVVIWLWFCSVPLNDMARVMVFVNKVMVWLVVYGHCKSIRGCDGETARCCGGCVAVMAVEDCGDVATSLSIMHL